MDLRLALHELALRHQLDEPARRRLTQLAGLDRPPAALAHWLPRGVAALAAGLTGFGLLLWIAANWVLLGRVGQFALLQSAVLLAGLAAAFGAAAWQRPAGLLTLLGTGGLLAYFGQTYQTGADPWQLFALWAVLMLPLCLALRSDLLWTPWALLVMTALTLWLHARLGHRWVSRPADLPLHLLGWGLALLLVALLGPGLRARLGSGPWSMRLAATLAVMLVGNAALDALFAEHVAAPYWLGLLVLVAAAGWFSLPQGFDVFGLSAVALSLDTLLVAGLTRWMFVSSHGPGVGGLLLLGLVAAGLLAGSVRLILRLTRLRGGPPDNAAVTTSGAAA
ncbi:MAG: DUF2157 domain-containing protein [Leptothrix sp. (in: b-proteobacteria)]